MKTKPNVICTCLSMILLLSGCGGGGGGGGTSPTVSPETIITPTLMAIEVAQTNPSIAKGYTQKFIATGIYSDDTKQDLTTSVYWSSSQNNVAVISNAAGTHGIATALRAGSTTVIATYGSVSGRTTLTVTAAVLESISITPTNASIALGSTKQFTATGIFSDTSTQDLTAFVTWSSAASGTATISNASGSSGLATSYAVGATTITAADPTSGISGTTELTVTEARLASIDVTPANPSVAKGLTEQFTATGIYTDSTTQDLTTSVTWSSSAAGAATISNASGTNGLATSVAAGAATITATDPSTGIYGTTVLTVTPATLVSISIAPTNPSVAMGSMHQFAATGTYIDGSTQDLTASVTWSSSAAGTATISNASGTNGLATSVAVGTATITATDPATGIYGTTVFTVTEATLVSINITPTNPSVAKGLTQPFTATGTYTDNTTQNLTASVTWSSSAAGTATISNASGTNGLATSVAVGTATITATDPTSGIHATAVLSVTAATLASMTVTPATPTIGLTQTNQFAATGTFTDGTTQELTASVTWSSSATGYATISNAAGSNGLATAVAVGSTTITATHPASGIAATAVLTVVTRVVSSYSLTPTNPSMALDETLLCKVTATYSDGTTADLNHSSVTWSSSNVSIATVADYSGNAYQELVTPRAVGTTTITAVTSDNVTLTTTLTVYSRTLMSIAVTPSNPTTTSGSLPLQMTATGAYSDGRTKDITSQATWSTSEAYGLVSSSGSVSLASGWYYFWPVHFSVYARSGSITGSTYITINR